MATTKTKTIDITGDHLIKNIWAFSVPLMLTNFLQMLFNAADTVVVGRFAGQQALAAVGATGSLCFLLISLFNGLSVGSNVIIARYIGADRQENISKAVHTSVAMAVISGLLLSVLGFFISKPMLHLMSTPDDIIDMSTLYMRLYFVGTFFGIVYNFASSVLRAKGDTKRPLYFLCISGITNVVLNLLFVAVLHMSVAGVAIATVISQAVSAVLVIVTLIKETDATHLDLSKLSMDWDMAANIIRIGIPAGIQGMVFSLSNVVIQSSINSFNSSTIVAANSAAANLEGFVYIGIMAFTQACITFTSQNIGAGKFDRVKSIMTSTMAMAVASALAFGAAVWIFGDFFLGFYTAEAAVVQTGKIRLLWVALPMFLNGILDILVASMRGMGISTLPTFTMIVGICGVRLGWIWLVFPVLGTLQSVYMCFPVSWAITSLIQMIFWIKGHSNLMGKAVLY